mgnify:CR=1 FL=1
MPNEEYQNVSSDARAIRQQLESARAGSKEMKQRIAALEADLETVSLDHKEALERMHKQHQIELGERDDRVELLEAQLKVCMRATPSCTTWPACWRAAVLMPNHLAVCRTRRRSSKANTRNGRRSWLRRPREKLPRSRSDARPNKRLMVWRHQRVESW